MSRAIWSLEARALPGADEELEDLLEAQATAGAIAMKAIVRTNLCPFSVVAPVSVTPKSRNPCPAGPDTCAAAFWPAFKRSAMPCCTMPLTGRLSRWFRYKSSSLTSTSSPAAMPVLRSTSIFTGRK